jgi:hypothetical protein
MVFTNNKLLEKTSLNHFHTFFPTALLVFYISVSNNIKALPSPKTETPLTQCSYS